MKKKNFFLDEAVHTPRYDEEGFSIYTDYGRHGPSQDLPRDLVEKTIRDLRLGRLYDDAFDGPKNAVGEWGYSFLNLDNFASSFDVYLQGGGWRRNTPTDDRDALAIIRRWLFTQFAAAPHSLEEGSAGMGSFNGHSHWQHYAGEWGFDYIGAEIGENVASHQAHLAFSRGAGKQYGKFSILYFSDWYQSTTGSWEETNTWEGFGFPDGGHSMSLLKRTYMMSYMGSVSKFVFEAGACLGFLGPNHRTEDGLLALSPYGEAMRELCDFTHRHPDVGLCYVPIGIVLDYYHGIAGYSLQDGASLKCHGKAFGYFDETPGDKMTWDLFALYYPGGGLLGGYMAPGMPMEETYQVNTPYGDTCDVLLQNADQRVLNSYPVLLLSGDITLSAEEAARYVAYVRQGGTLLCNTAYLKYFDKYAAAYQGGTRQDIPDGEGTVIVYGPDYSVENLGDILQEQLRKYIPFTFSEDVEYLMNVKDGSLIVTVINNKGVTKERLGDPVVDETAAIDLTVTYTGETAVKAVRELYYNQPVNADGNTVRITVGPGDYRVLEFVFD
ncbi:MAG: hypothetical protein IJ518_02915 [Clostridia bacterium]|nr:hypothetical protein [Clostridia bacterium]